MDVGTCMAHEYGDIFVMIGTWFELHTFDSGYEIYVIRSNWLLRLM
jgi:hypothetical protein